MLVQNKTLTLYNLDIYIELTLGLGKPPWSLDQGQTGKVLWRNFFLCGEQRMCGRL